MRKDIMFSDQEVTPYTMAILPNYNDNGHLESLVMEGKEEFIVSKSPLKMIDSACTFFGASLSGRQKGTKAVSQMTHKVPVSIDGHSGMYFFPTTSPINPKCAWIAHSHIESVNRTEDGFSELIFKNGKSIKLEISLGSLLNQINRTAQYRYTLGKRLNHLISFDENEYKNQKRNLEDLDKEQQ